MLNIEFYVGTISFLIGEINELPEYRICRHRGIEVIRGFSGGKRFEYRISSPKGQEAFKIKARRDRLMAELDKFREDLLKYHNVIYEDICSQYVISTKVRHKFDKRFWDSLGESKSVYEKDNNYYHNDEQFRSRVEVRMSELLDNLGVRYKYEVRIKVNGEGYDVDFVIGLLQFNCCFLSEYFGAMERPHRRATSVAKFDNYSAAGIFPGQDILYLCGTENMMPSTEVIEESVCAIINAISRQHVIRVI